MDVNHLISSAPAINADEIEAADWFTEVKTWAQQNNQPSIVQNTGVGITFLPYADRRKQYIITVLSELKVLRKMDIGTDMTPKVFIVHGHDDALKQEIARTLEKSGLKPIILSEQANRGQTIIEKLEEQSDGVKYAIILYTGDDAMSNGNKRARQNVVFEHGYFTAKLGRKFVCVIKDVDVEPVGDNDGVIYIDRQSWKSGLPKELKAAGLPVDLDRWLG